MKRPPVFPAVSAPLTTPSCTCPMPLPIRTGDGIARCLRCSGAVETQPSLLPGEREAA